MQTRKHVGSSEGSGPACALRNLKYSEEGGREIEIFCRRRSVVQNKIEMIDDAQAVASRGCTGTRPILKYFPK